MTRPLSSLPADALARALREAEGVALHLGPYVARVRTPLPDVARAVGRLYTHHALADTHAVADFDVAVRRPGGLHRWWRPQVTFDCDGETPFNPLPGDQGFPLLEWGLNWCVYGQCHQHLTLHAAVLERAGRALLLPAPSGSGKSTLCAALLFRGWRLLSDELALIDPADGAVIPMPRPVSLKNASIDVMRRFVPGLEFGSLVHETAKGYVGHFAPPADSVAAATRRASPAWVVFPRFVAGQTAVLAPIERAQAFMRLVENAFNYDVFGPEGFDLLARLVDGCACHTFEYGDLDEAIRVFDALASSPDPGGGGALVSGTRLDGH